MAHILSFEVSGLNGRNVPVGYPLDRHVNVFFGSNGSGKTSILKIIDSAMGNDIGRIKNTAFDHAKVVIHSIDFESDFTLIYNKKGTINQSGVVSSLEGELFDAVDRKTRERRQNKEQDIWRISPESSEKKLKRIRWRHSYLPTSRLYIIDNKFDPDSYLEVSGHSVGTDAVVLEDALDRSFAISVQDLWTRKYGEISARVRTIQQNALQSIFLDALLPEQEAGGEQTVPAKELLNANRAFERMASFLQRQSDGRITQTLGSFEDFEKRYRNNSRLRRIVNHIDAVEESIEYEMRPIHKISTLIERLFIKGKSLSFDAPRIEVKTEGDRPIAIGGLSSGEKHLIRILLAAMDADKNTLIIDEPELSLHIDWQRELINDIRSLNPDCQLILATHSPEIMADIPDENIFRI